MLQYSLVLGMAGYALTTQTPLQPSPIAMHRDQKHYGYSKLIFKTKDEMTVQFIDVDDNDNVLVNLKKTDFACKLEKNLCLTLTV